MAEVHLTIRTLHGESKQFGALAADSVKALKDKIAEWQNSIRDNVIVMLGGRSLDDDMSLEAEGVRDGTRLMVAVKGKQLQKSVSMECPPVKESPLLNHSRSMLQPSPVEPPPPVTPRGLIRSPPVPKPSVPPQPGRPVAPPQPGKPGPSGIRANESPAISDGDVATLVEMGFTDVEAHAALMKANGRVEIAAAILSGDTQENTLENLRAEIRKDPSKLEFYVNALLAQSAEARQAEEQNPGHLRRLLTGEFGVPPQRSNPAAEARAVAHITEMGFTEQQARRALAEANGNEERALDILLNS